jgi:hypothetical protein
MQAKDCVWKAKDEHYGFFFLTIQGLKVCTWARKVVHKFYDSLLQNVKCCPLPCVRMAMSGMQLLLVPSN